MLALSPLLLSFAVPYKMLIDTPFDKERVARQVESLFEFGTIGESVVDALGLDETHDLQTSVLNQPPPVAVIDQKLFTFCPPQ